MVGLEVVHGEVSEASGEEPRVKVKRTVFRT